MEKVERRGGGGQWTCG